MADRPQASQPSLRTLDRRAFLAALSAVGAASSIAGCGGSGGRRNGRQPIVPTLPASGSRRLLSAPELRPPPIAVTKRPADPLLGSYVFTDVHGGSGQQGPLIIDRAGRLVYFRPVSDHGTPRLRAFDVRVQRYYGESVLTHWIGATVDGHGEGHYELYDQRYRLVAKVHAGNGYRGDLHEFRLTDAGTALLTAYGYAHGDLPVGPENSRRRGAYYYGVAQEVEIATGDVRLEWRSNDHVPLSASYESVPADREAVWDYFHINSIAVDPDDNNLIISGRNTWAFYKVERHSGRVLWTCGGRDTDFEMGHGTHFAFQHHVVPRGNGVFTLFDNQGGPPNEALQSRALILHVDARRRRVSFIREYRHRPPVLSEAQGSVQLLGSHSSKVFVGWGDSTYFTEYDRDGTVVLDARLDAPGVLSYRAFESHWNGMPEAAPRLAVVRHGRAASLYASWNGSTEHGGWRVLGGADARELTALGVAASDGFETEIQLAHAPTHVAVEPLDDVSGRALSRSAVVAVGA
ncbi:MAG TPA: arylsulfotransferase family protein [Solirubrobacteraceae bacterium]